MADVPRWELTGDWFDVCRCRVPCGCTFAQPPDEDVRDGILAWHVRDGRYGDVALDGLNVWSWPGRPSKHFTFAWSGPDEA